MKPPVPIRAIQQLRNRRKDLLGCDLFGDPAWDILLDLYAAGLEGRTVSVTSACIASGAPDTTALRYLCHLEKAGLVERRQDIADGRRRFVRLTEAGHRGIDAWLDKAGYLARAAA